jgi:hypothetical protein
MDNKKLWNAAFVTDPRAVKEIIGKSYKGNSPKPFWLIERATDLFGPVGIGWGVIVKSERFERLSEDDVLHVAVVSVWFMHEGKRSETFDQMGGTKACYRTAKGLLMVDEDAGKKSVTDGMVKCLSMIGFAGDIFSGAWNDSKYVGWALEQYTNPPPATEMKHSPTGEPLVDASRRSIIADTAEAIKEHFQRDDVIGAYEDATGITDPEEKTLLWKMLPSNIRAALKKHSEFLKETA